MRAVTIDDGALAIAERPDPSPGPGEILVGVRAAGVNGADILQRKGGYPAPPGSPADIRGSSWPARSSSAGATPSASPSATA